MGYVSDNDEEFSIYDRDAIAIILRNMSQKNVPLSGGFNGGADVLLTCVVGVDTRANLVYIDVNANEEFNRNFLASKRVTFNAFFGGAKIMWASGKVQDTEYEEQRAFAIALPERMQRIQRRGSFRVSTPLMNPVICKIALTKEKEISLPLFDICIEGVGLIVPMPPDAAFTKMTEYRNCKLEHPDLGQLEISIYVKSIWEITLANGSKALRAGVEFTNLQPAIQKKIQKFVYQMERQLIASRAPS